MAETIRECLEADTRGSVFLLGGRPHKGAFAHAARGLGAAIVWPMSVEIR